MRSWPREGPVIIRRHVQYGIEAIAELVHAASQHLWNGVEQLQFHTSLVLVFSRDDTCGWQVSQGNGPLAT